MMDFAAVMGLMEAMQDEGVEFGVALRIVKAAKASLR